MRLLLVGFASIAALRLGAILSVLACVTLLAAVAFEIGMKAIKLSIMVATKIIDANLLFKSITLENFFSFQTLFLPFSRHSSLRPQDY
jgi:hypothetical protein